MKQSLYRLPFSKYNNPNGWIEPTTFCQLKCPHCYRGADNADFKSVHRNLTEILSEIDELIKIRNIQTLTIAGGEPLLYPQLVDLIKYAVSKKLNVYLITNGILIDKERLIELKKSGVTRIIIHIDKYQNRKSATTEKEVNDLRLEYCRLFRKVGGISLGFMMPISADNFQELDVLVPFFKDNADVIKEIGLTVLCEVLPDKELPENKKIDAKKIFMRVKKLYGLEYCAYLSKTNTNGISWLFSYNIFAGKKLLGSIDKKVARFIQEDYHKKTDKYLFVSNKRFSLRFIALIFNKSIIKIFWKNFINILSTKINDQSIFIINTPQKINDKWDCCDGCPDAIIFKGDLVPSCLLERVKQGENIRIE